MIILSSTRNVGDSPDHRPTPRLTRQRAAIFGALAELESFQSAQEIHACLRNRGEAIGLATVYRCLALMDRAGDVDVLRREDGEASYLVCSKGHHHHLICRTCGHAIEISGPDIQRWTEQLAARYGYTGPSHALEVFGLCPSCSAAERPSG